MERIFKLLNSEYSEDIALRVKAMVDEGYLSEEEKNEGIELFVEFYKKNNRIPAELDKSKDAPKDLTKLKAFCFGYATIPQMLLSEKGIQDI